MFARDTDKQRVRYIIFHLRSVPLAPSIGGKRSQLIHDALAHLLRPPPAPPRTTADGGSSGSSAPARPPRRRAAAADKRRAGANPGPAPAAWARMAELVRRCTEAELLTAVPSDARAVLPPRRRAG